MRITVELREPFWFVIARANDVEMVLAIKSTKIEALEEARRKLMHGTAIIDAHLLIEKNEAL